MEENQFIYKGSTYKKSADVINSSINVKCLRNTLCTCILVITVYCLINSTLLHSWNTLDYVNLYVEDNCNIKIVESIPVGLNFTNHTQISMSTFDAWQLLLNTATESVDIGSFYWTLRNSDVVNHSTANEGEEIFQSIISNAISKKLKIRIAQNAPNLDTEELKKKGAADVRSVNFSKLLGNGVLHSKLWIVDNKHFYLGSANMDWRSLTQVKELGVLVQNCSYLALDIAKLFEVYWYLGLNTSVVPHQWPEKFSTIYNVSHPMRVNFNKNFTMSTYFSSSPPPFSPTGRSNDLDAILENISSAKLFINIAVMDYFPLLIYSKSIKYWSSIDDAIRTAAIERKISIKMLISWWPHSNASEDYFLRSLQSLTDSLEGVDIQIVTSNSDQKKIKFSRVNHNKYMVTDNTAYIGTSNWSGDYFTDTAGIGLTLRVFENDEYNLRADLLKIFQRDWESSYALKLYDYFNKITK